MSWSDLLRTNYTGIGGTILKGGVTSQSVTNGNPLRRSADYSMLEEGVGCGG